MVVEVIYVTRHGYRSSWAVNSVTGEYRNSFPTPTGIPSDPALTSHGVTQAVELAERLAQLDPPVQRWYSSPYYRCLQTIRPAVELVRANTAGSGEEVRIEPGIGEWHGLAPFAHPPPPTLPVLQPHFPSLISPSYAPHLSPHPNGESIPALHDRVAAALERVIADLDAEEGAPRAALLCSHAAPIIAIGRVLTGRMPEDVGEEDFGCCTCALSVFVRRVGVEGGDGRKWEDREEGWWKGKGVGGGWKCVMNGDTTFLSGGAERGWHFSGDESFMDVDDFDELGAGRTSELEKGSKL